MDMIQVSGLHKSFGELKVLQGIGSGSFKKAKSW